MPTCRPAGAGLTRMDAKQQSWLCGGRPVAMHHLEAHLSRLPFIPVHPLAAPTRSSSKEPSSSSEERLPAALGSSSCRVNTALFSASSAAGWGSWQQARSSLVSASRQSTASLHKGMEDADSKACHVRARRHLRLQNTPAHRSGQLDTAALLLVPPNHSLTSTQIYCVCPALTRSRCTGRRT